MRAAKVLLAASVALIAGCGIDSFEGVWSTSLTCNAGVEKTGTLTYSFDGIDLFERTYTPEGGQAEVVAGRYAYDPATKTMDLDNCLEGEPPSCSFRPMESWTDVAVTADGLSMTFQAGNRLTTCLKGTTVSLTLHRR